MFSFFFEDFYYIWVNLTDDFAYHLTGQFCLLCHSTCFRHFDSSWGASFCRQTFLNHYLSLFIEQNLTIRMSLPTWKSHDRCKCRLCDWKVLMLFAAFVAHCSHSKQSIFRLNSDNINIRSFYSIILNFNIYFICYLQRAYWFQAFLLARCLLLSQARQ